MTRFFYTVFFSFLSLGIACIVAAFFLNSVPNPFEKVTDLPIEIQTAEVKSVPLEQKIEKATNNPLKIVQICQGEILPPQKNSEVTAEENRAADTETSAVVEAKDTPSENQPALTENSSLVDETNVDTQQASGTVSAPSKSMRRTYIFVSAEEGVPEIITAKLIRPDQAAAEVSSVSIADANQPMIAEHGFRAEHGTFNQLRDLDHARGQSRYDDLWQNAKSLCFKDFSERDQNDKTDDLRLKATAFIQLDMDLDDPNAKLQIFYQVNGFIHQQEALLSERPI